MKSVIQREITPTQNLTYTGHYKCDENQCDAYKDALLEKDSIDSIIYLDSLLDNDKFYDIDVLVSKMNNIYLNAASKTLIYKRPRRPNNQRLPGACNRSPGSKLISITTQLHCGGHLGGRA